MKKCHCGGELDGEGVCLSCGQFTIGAVKAWHDPKNEACPHNADAGADCECKRVVNRKAYKVARVTDRSVSHGIRPQIILQIFPDGRLVLREHGRRMTTTTTLGIVYENCLMRDARVAERNKKLARKARRAAKQ